MDSWVLLKAWTLIFFQKCSLVVFLLFLAHIVKVISYMVCHEVLLLFIQNALCCGLQLLSACYASTEGGVNVKACSATCSLHKFPVRL